MAGNSTFHGLAALAARAGIKIRGANTPAPAVEEDGTTPPSTDEEEDGTSSAPEGEQDGGNTDTPPEGNTQTETEEDDNVEIDTSAPDAGGGAEGGNDAEAATRPSNPSADFLAGERYGAEQASGRFAAVLMDEDCRANLGMATDLLAETSMSADKIVAYVKRNKAPQAGGGSAAQRLLDTTPKVDLGAGNGGQQTGADAGKQARKSAVANVNNTRGGRKAAGPIRRSRRAAAGTKEN